MSYLKKHNYTTLAKVYKNIDNFILLTSSQILTNHYKNKLDLMASKDHSTFWEKTPTLQLNLWARNLYADIEGRKTIINETYKQMLAYKLIRSINSNISANKTMQIAKKAITTLDYCQKWHIPYQSISSSEIAPNFSLQKLVKNIAQEISAKKLIDEVGIIANVAKLIAGQKIQVGKNIALIGFEYLDPTTKDLINALSEKTTVYWLEKKIEQNDTKWLESEHAKSAYYDFDTWYKTLPKDAIVGFFTPNINTGEIYRYSKLAFRSSYHIKHNQNIASFSIIEAALDLLKLTTTNIKTSLIVKIISSPYILTANYLEKTFISKLQQKLTEHEKYISIGGLLKTLSGGKNEKDLINTLEFIKNNNNQKTLLEHIKTFKEILTIAKWPLIQNEQESKLSSELAKIFNTLINCPGANITMNSDDALDIITEIAKNHNILLDDNSSHIQICDIATGSFLDYDYVWIASLNESSWPIYSKAKTYINQSTLEKYTYSESEQIIMAQHALNRITNSSLICIYNYAKIVNELPSSSSYMIEEIIKNHKQLVLHHDIKNDYQNFYNPSIATPRKAEETIPLLPSEHSLNTYTIRDFNTCHFKSFAKFRLFAKEPHAPSLGIKNIDKGIIIHNVLQQLYSGKKYLYELKNITQQEVEPLINKNIRDTVKYKPNSASESFIKSISEQLTTIILSWLEYDTNRENCQIHAIEQELIIKIDNITIRGIVDRVDKLSNDKYIIIDYKTGAANPSHWFQEDIKEPQMPIYSLSYPTDLAALCYGHVSQNNIGMSGIAEKNIIPAIKTAKNTPDKEIHDIIIQWHQNITQTLTEYAKGSIKTIEQNHQECNKCPYSGICRIWEKNSGN